MERESKPGNAFGSFLDASRSWFEMNHLVREGGFDLGRVDSDLGLGGVDSF